MKKTAKKNPKPVQTETTSPPIASENVTVNITPSERARQRAITSRQAAINRVLAY